MLLKAGVSVFVLGDNLRRRVVVLFVEELHVTVLEVVEYLLVACPLTEVLR